MNAVGWVHVGSGLAALAAGLAVLLLPKGSRLHRVLGWTYAASMAALTVSALMIYRLFGHPGPFHVLGIVCLAILARGIAAARARRRNPRWMVSHVLCMGWSYIGLLAATATEVAIRVPAWGGNLPAALLTSAIASVAVTVAGAAVMARCGARWRKAHPGTGVRHEDSAAADTPLAGRPSSG